MCEQNHAKTKLVEAISRLTSPLRASVPVGYDPRGENYQQVCHHGNEIRFLLKHRQWEEWSESLRPILDDLDRLVESPNGEVWNERSPAIAKRLGAFAKSLNCSNAQKGGAPRKWTDLLAIHDDPTNEGLTRKQVVDKYNQRYSTRERATVNKLKGALTSRKHSEQKPKS